MENPSHTCDTPFLSSFTVHNCRTLASVLKTKSLQKLTFCEYCLHYTTWMTFMLNSWNNICCLLKLWYFVAEIYFSKQFRNSLNKVMKVSARLYGIAQLCTLWLEMQEIGGSLAEWIRFQRMYVASRSLYHANLVHVSESKESYSQINRK